MTVAPPDRPASEQDPIYSPPCGVFDPLRPIDGLELIAAVQKILGRESPACYRLFRWARVRAEGGSFRELCREMRATARDCADCADQPRGDCAAQLNAVQKLRESSMPVFL
jgi:hypothetical protein